MWLRSLALWLLPWLALASEANLSWVAPTVRVDGSPVTNLAGYRLFERCGSDPLALLATVNVPALSYQRTGLPDGVTCYWSLTAFDADGIESARTNEASRTFVPGVVTNLVIAWAPSQGQGPPSMALSRFGGGTAQYNPATTQNIAWPASVTANMIAVVTASWYDSGGTDRSPFTSLVTNAGFTERTPSGGVVVATSATIESRFAVYTKELTGSETGNLAIAFGASVFANVILDVYQGTNDLTFASISAADLGTSSDATAPSVSGTSGQGLIAAYGLTDPPGTTNSGPSGMTLGGDAVTNTNSARTYFQTLASTGATGVKTWDFTTSRDWAGVAILLDGADAGGGGATVDLSGVSATGSAGAIAVSGKANAPLTGVEGAGAAGTIAVALNTPVAVPSAAAAGAAGAMAVSGLANVTIIGNAASGSAGLLNAVGTAAIPLSGVEAFGDAGPLEATSGLFIPLTGVSAAGQAGDLAVSAAIIVSLSGVSADGLPGTVNALVSGGVTIALTGVSADGQVGDIGVAADVAVSVTGVAAVAAAGNLAAVTSVSIEIPGVLANGQAAALVVTGTANVPLTGAEAEALAGVLAVLVGRLEGSGERVIRVDLQSRTVDVGITSRLVIVNRTIH